MLGGITQRGGAWVHASASVAGSTVVVRSAVGRHCDAVVPLAYCSLVARRPIDLASHGSVGRRESHRCFVVADLQLRRRSRIPIADGMHSFTCYHEPLLRRVSSRSR